MKNSSLHIGVNTLFLSLGRYAGIETYARELMRALPTLDPAVKYTVFTAPQVAGTFREQASTVEEVICLLPRIANRKIAWSSRLAYEYGVLARQVARRRVDVLFSPGFTAPAHPRYASVVTVPDMQHVDLPDNFGSVDRTIFLRLLARSVRSAAQIITLSEHAKRRIVAHYHVPPDRVTVTYLAASPTYFAPVSPDAIARVRQAYGLHAPYILSVATLLQHKNLDILIDAFLGLRQEHGWDGQLALTGLPGNAMGALQQRIDTLGLAGQIIVTGYVPDGDLPALYQGAEVFVLPSRYEGFGIPVLEAMASGTPVITTTATSLPEVAGDAALLFDPDDCGALVAGLARVLDDEGMRQNLVGRGRERAQLFTWRKSAERTLAVFRGAMHPALSIERTHDNPNTSL